MKFFSFSGSFLLLGLLIFPGSPDGKLEWKYLKGSWKVAVYYDENHQRCQMVDTLTSREFIFQKDSSFRANINFEGKGSRHKGRYTVNTETGFMVWTSNHILLDDGTEIVSEPVQFGARIVELTKEKLVFRVNCCCMIDTCGPESGWMEFHRVQKKGARLP